MRLNRLWGESCQCGSWRGRKATVSEPLRGCSSSHRRFIKSNQIFCKKGNYPGNKVDYTACSLLAILKHLCSKLHCQKGFNLVLFSYNIVRYSIEARNLECRLSSDSGHKPRSRSRTWISWMLVFTPHILPPFYHLK